MTRAPWAKLFMGVICATYGCSLFRGVKSGLAFSKNATERRLYERLRPLAAVGLRCTGCPECQLRSEDEMKETAGEE